MTNRATKLAASGRILPLTMMVMLIAVTPATAADVGDVAPDFEIATQDGNVLRLSDLRGRKPVYVVFWNSWCSYCTKKVPRYVKLQEQFGDKIEIIAINTTWSDSPEKMRVFEDRFNVNYSTAFDIDELITDSFEVINVPAEFIIDVNGIIRYRNSVPEYPIAHLPDWSVTNASFD
jgi:peroxiredoxin